jgi:hypothetical protein
MVRFQSPHLLGCLCRRSQILNRTSCAIFVALLLTLKPVEARLHLWYNSHLACSKNKHSSLLLSIVAVSSNTDASQVERLQVSLNTLDEHARAHSLTSQIEVVLVEYNYDPGQPSLASMLTLRETMPLIRILRVSPEQHEYLVSKTGVAFKVKFLEYTGKNIGIRRACGEFLLVTNPDIILSESFFTYLSKFGLANDTYYRIPRCNSNVDASALKMKTASEIQRALQDTLDGNCWWSLPQPIPWSTYVRSEFTTTTPLVGELWKECIFAPGDFTLLSREAYHRYRGYPEVALPTMLDDVIVWQAVADGMKLVVLPKPTVTYHINHAKGYNSADERWAKSEAMKRAYQLNEAGRRMMDTHTVEVFNDESWGLAHVPVTEVPF